MSFGTPPRKKRNDNSHIDLFVQSELLRNAKQEKLVVETCPPENLQHVRNLRGALVNPWDEAGGMNVFSAITEQIAGNVSTRTTKERTMLIEHLQRSANAHYKCNPPNKGSMEILSVVGRPIKMQGDARGFIQSREEWERAA